MAGSDRGLEQGYPAPLKPLKPNHRIKPTRFHQADGDRALLRPPTGSRHSLLLHRQSSGIGRPSQLLFTPPGLVIGLYLHTQARMGGGAAHHALWGPLGGTRPPPRTGTQTWNPEVLVPHA
jgi:hypothetical protein